MAPRRKGKTRKRSPHRYDTYLASRLRPEERTPLTTRAAARRPGASAQNPIVLDGGAEDGSAAVPQAAPAQNSPSPGVQHPGNDSPQNDNLTLPITEPDPRALDPTVTGTVIDYLAKKGYSRTEAMLRMESANQEIDGRPLPHQGEDARPRIKQGFETLKRFIDENIDIYKPELNRLLWPLFVYSFLSLVTSFYPAEAKQFFDANKNMFLPQHKDDVRALQSISLPEHVQSSETANIYRNNKYRITMTSSAFANLLQHLEQKEREGGFLMLSLLSSYCALKRVDRAQDYRLRITEVMNQVGLADSGDSMPMEDEGIPGHHPGSAYTGDNPAMAGTLPRLKLGKLPPDSKLAEDVREDLRGIDAQNEGTGVSSLVQEYNDMIKEEEGVEGPTRAELGIPESTAIDVAMTVQRVKDHRDRLRLEGPTRTGGVGAPVSIVMYTFHNTFDSVNCIDFSQDMELAATGTSQSYIQVWTLDGKAIKRSEPDVPNLLPPAASHKLIGHSGPVFAVSFKPSAPRKDLKDKDYEPTHSRWLLSASADKSIRLWYLDTMTCVVAYSGHMAPVFDVRWGPFGHFFAAGGNDTTGQLWATEKKDSVRMFVGHDKAVSCVAFHPNTLYVFTAGCDRTVRMWAVTTGNAVRMFTGHTGNITALEASKDGKYVASADDDGSIIIWDLESGRLFKRMRGHGKMGIWSLSWNAESTLIASGGADCTVRVWEVYHPQDAPTQGRVVSEGASTFVLDADPTNAAGAGPAAASAQAKKKKVKESVETADMINSFPTRKSPVYKVMFTGMNLILAGGAYLPLNQA